MRTHRVETCDLQPRPALSAPPPVKAMLAICSDLDETPDAETYFEIMRFLNTTEETRMGPGVGLEAGNTMYFDMPRGHFSYWNTAEENREKIRVLIKSGHIDCLHSYGDLAATRAHAGRALDELAKHDCQFKIWIDHAQAPTNLGTDIMQGHGAERGHPAYHADLTIGHGIEYVWRGRVTSVVGQDCPPSCGGIWNSAHPFTSTRTIAKEAAKQSLGRCGSAKYALHGNNRTLNRALLADNTPVVEFIRCNPHWAGVSGADRGDRIDEVLTRPFLDRLVRRNASCILYTHLGKLCQNPDRHAFSPATIGAFRLLAEYQQKEKITVLTTRRLLACSRKDRLPPEKLDFPL